MKKTIFGSALMICGTIAVCAEYLSGRIQFASPDIAKVGSNYLLQYGGPILLIIGLFLHYWLDRKEQRGLTKFLGFYTPLVFSTK